MALYSTAGPTIGRGVAVDGVRSILENVKCKLEEEKHMPQLERRVINLPARLMYLSQPSSFTDVAVHSSRSK